MQHAKPFFQKTTVSQLSEQEERTLYATAFSLYDVGHYVEGANLFTQLVLASPFIDRYWRGLAACKQMVQDYSAALHAWSLVALLSDRDPLPHFHAAECLISLKEYVDAVKALNAAEQLLTETPEDQQLHEKIRLLRTTHA